MQIDCANVRGYYQERTSTNEVLTECKICPAGYACPYGSKDKTACNPGFFAIGGQEHCTACPAGYECPSTEMPQMNYCKTGTYSLGEQDACTICPAGSECVGSIILACTEDRWSNEGEGICKFLPAGQQASITYTGGVRDDNPCSDGWFSTRGTAECLECPLGHYCPTNMKHLQPRTCEPGTYAGSTGMTSCDPCPSGQYSLYGQSECYPVPKGYSATVQTTVGDQVPQKCPMGTYSLGESAMGSSAGILACAACTDGKICKDGSMTADPADSLCPAGQLCKTVSSVFFMNPCAGGTYNPSRGQVSLSVIYGLESCTTPCGAGYYCPPGSSEQFLCPPGHYCGASSALPTKCRAGSYNKDFGA